MDKRVFIAPHRWFGRTPIQFERETLALLANKSFYKMALITLLLYLFLR